MTRYNTGKKALSGRSGLAEAMHGVKPAQRIEDASRQWIELPRRSRQAAGPHGPLQPGRSKAISRVVGCVEHHDSMPRRQHTSGFCKILVPAISPVQQYATHGLTEEGHAGTRHEATDARLLRPRARRLVESYNLGAIGEPLGQTRSPGRRTSDQEREAGPLTHAQ
jgi:hypothetical protein